MLARVKDQFVGAWETSRFRVLLEGPICRVWFLGERFLRQSLGLPKPVVPMPPPTYIRITERYTPQEMIDFMIGWDADLFRLDGDYTVFIQTYLMPALTRAQRGGRDRAPTAAENAGGSRATQAHDRKGSKARRRAGWLELPTTMTCQGRAGETYQIPIAPRGPTPVCTIRYILQTQFISVFALQITNHLNTFTGIHKVHRAGSRAVGFFDGDGADEHGPAQHLQHPGKFFQPTFQNPL